MQRKEHKKVIRSISFEEAIEQYKNISNDNKQLIERVEKINSIVKRIVSERQDKGISQRELADKCGIKQPMIARFEKVEMMPRLDTLLRLTDALELDFDISSKIIYKQDMQVYCTFSQNDYIYDSQGGFYNDRSESQQFSHAQA